MSEPLPVDLGPSELAKHAGVSVPFAHQVLAGKKPLPRHVAISIYRLRQVKLGPIVNATEDEIDVLERFEGRAA